jgi:hypothetical protein
VLGRRGEKEGGNEMTQKLKAEIEALGCSVVETSEGTFIRSYNNNGIKQTQELFKKYPGYSLGCFAKCDLFELFYYEALLKEE